MTIGFSDKAFSELSTGNEYRKKYLKDINFNAIELCCISEEMLDHFIKDVNVADYDNFEYISMHAPRCLGKTEEKTIRIWKKIEKMYKKFKLKNIVLHPDRIENWEIFKDFRYLPLSIENMDNRKESGKNIRDIEKIISKYDFNLTLDLNHCFGNDETMVLAEEFQKKFKNKIVEYHISGHGKPQRHVPFFKTKQNEILNFVKLKNIPIIIESILDEAGDKEKEFDYIMKNLK